MCLSLLGICLVIRRIKVVDKLDNLFLHLSDFVVFNY